MAAPDQESMDTLSCEYVMNPGVPKRTGRQLSFYRTNLKKKYNVGCDAMLIGRALPKNQRGVLSPFSG
jgi:hypothetical protein